LNLSLQFKRTTASQGRLLTPPARSETSTLHSFITMGQQLNKKIKRKRRAAYLKRKKEKVKTAAKKK
jgi:hypothetical protein